jgi:flagellin
MVFTSDGTANGGQDLNVTVGVLSSASVGTATPGTGEDLSATDLNSAANAATALTKIGSAINDIANQRGAVGANVNRLMATVNNAGTEQINFQDAVNSIQNADIGKTVANMTQYNILQATGMAALQEANQAQQAVLKLV